MLPRERVEKALNHEEPDRCPWNSTFTPEFATRLLQEMSSEELNKYNPHGGGNTYALERALGQDMLLTSVGWANSYYQEDGDYVDEWGVGWESVDYETRFGKGRYTEISDHPLADEEALEDYTPPDPNRDELYRAARQTVEQYGDEYWIVGVTVTTIFECAWALRGLEKLLMDFAVNPDLAESILDIPYQYHLTAAKRLVDLGVDMIWVGDDLGTQSGMLISPKHWRTFLKPRLSTFISELKRKNPDLKVAYHSDGDIYEVIPELIEIGVDVLNPVQPACLDLPRLQDKFGDRLSFWGSIDEQRTLPFGTPGDVEEEVIDRLRTLGRGGGLIVAPTHHVQLDTPIENFNAMVETVRQTPYSSL